MPVEEHKGITWDLDGSQLTGSQAANRLYYGGFKDAKELTEMAATLFGESGWYLKAWHHNVDRTDDGEIKRDPNGMIVILSTDLGFIQRNVVHDPAVHLADAACKPFALDLFNAHPELAKADSSSKIAWALYEQRGWQPWYAHSSGAYKKHLGRSGLAVANFLAVEFGLAKGPFDDYYTYSKSAKA